MALMEVEESAHPRAEQLRKLAQGRLSSHEAMALEDHLADCASCCRFLEAAPDDSFVASLREAQHVPAADTYLATNAIAPSEMEEPAELADHPRYRLIRLLGRGGMGAVYLADHRHMGRPVALKVINAELLNQRGALARFQQEARAAAKLDHRNIVAAYDADQAGKVHFLVMEYVEGQNLADYLAQKGPLPIAQACDIIRQAALGLQHAHERGMVHRDIKPHNVMLTPAGQVKVLDFGLARFAAEPALAAGALATSGMPQLTGAGAVIGSADYIAPEQARDAHEADSRSDIYSLGCTLYQLLTGLPPFPKGTALEKLECHSAADPRRLATLRPEIPNDLNKVVTKMIAKRPEDRYQTAADVAVALARFAVGKSRSRFSFRVKTALAALVLATCSIAAAAGVVRLSAGDREIVIETDDPSIEVVVQGEKIVRIVDPKTGKAYQLDRDDLTLTLADDPDGLTVTLDGERPLTLKRQGERIATVRVAENNGLRTTRIHLNHAKASRVAAFIMQGFGNPRHPVTLKCDHDTNVLEVQTTASGLALIQTLVKEVDRKDSGNIQVGRTPPPIPIPPPPPAETRGSKDDDIQTVQLRLWNAKASSVWSLLTDPARVTGLGIHPLRLPSRISHDDTANTLEFETTARNLAAVRSLIYAAEKAVSEQAAKSTPPPIPIPPPSPPRGRSIPAVPPLPMKLTSSSKVGEPSEDERLVQIEVVVARVNRAEARKLATRWSGIWRDDKRSSNPKEQWRPIFGVTDKRPHLMEDLAELVDKKMAKIVSEPRVVTKSGTSAWIVSGGEAPIPPILNDSGHGDPTVTYKMFGLIVGCLPTIQRNGKISLEVNPELSDVDNAVGISRDGPEPLSIPGFRTQKSQVMVELESGSTLVMGGFIDARPKEEEVELIFLVTPRLIDLAANLKRHIQIDVAVAHVKVEEAKALWPKGSEDARAVFQVPNAKVALLKNGDTTMIKQLLKLQDAGSSKLLQRTIMTVSGKPGYMVNGGQTPIITTSGEGTRNVTFKMFGTIVNCLPIVVGNGKIHMEVRPEISNRNPASDISLPSAEGTTNVPGFDIRTAQVTMEMEDGQTLAIGGLMQKNIISQSSKVPVLGDLPVLGSAFTSKTYTETEEEFIILVTPRLVGPAAGGDGRSR